MTHGRRRFGAALAVAIAFLLTMLTACGGGGGAAEPGTLRVASNSNATALPFWVAQEQGMFEKQGLEVEYTKIENIATLPQALGTSFDIVLSTPTLAISSTSQGIPMVEVAGSSVDSPGNPSSFLMVDGAKGITDVTQLAGKTIGVLNETGTLHTATLYWLQKEGVDLDSVNVVQVDGPAQADQLRTGRVDAVETVTPFSSQIEKVGGTSLGTPYRSMAQEITPIYWASRTDWANAHADEISKFVAALNEAQQFIAANDAEAREILQEQTGYSDEVVANLALPTYNTEVRPQDVQLWLDAMRSVTGFTGQVDPAALVHQP
jgi:NitT/TauT family transport system substrate-binding protein